MKSKVTFSRTLPAKEGGGEERWFEGTRRRRCLCRVRGSDKYAAEGTIWGEEKLTVSAEHDLTEGGMP